MADEIDVPEEEQGDRQTTADPYDGLSQDIDDLRNVDQTFYGGKGEQAVRDYARKKFGKKDDGNEGGEGAESGDDKLTEDSAESGDKNPDQQGADNTAEGDGATKTNNPDAEATDATGNPPSESTPPGTDATGGTGESLSQSGSDAVGNMGEGLPSAGEKAVDATSKLADTAQKTEEAVEKGEKAIEAVNKTVQAGEAVAEGVTAGAEGTAVAAAPETAGISLAVAAAIEGAKQGAKAAKKAYDVVKKGMKYKDAVESAGRLVKKYGKWCACCFIPPVIIGVIGYYVWTKLINLNPAVAAVKAVISLFHRNNSSGKLNFTNTASNTAIDNNEVSEVALRIMTDLSEAYDVTINYKGNISPATGKQNENYEFDLVAADYIKCTDTSTNKKDEPPIQINLSEKFDWNSVIAAGKENYVCAVGYYPGIDTPPLLTMASSLYGPAEFALKDIATYGPQAAQQKLYETLELVMAKSKNNEDEFGDFPVSRIMIPKTFYDTNLKTGQAGLGVTLKRRSQEIFPDRSADEIIVSDSNTEGAHIGFD